MKYLETAKLRNDLLSKIGHQYELPEIEAALDEFADAVIANAKEEQNALVREMLYALEKCKPYMQDLEAENFSDASAGIWADNDLSMAYNLLKFAIKKAKGL